jgi:hypothetical protein
MPQRTPFPGDLTPLPQRFIVVNDESANLFFEISYTKRGLPFSGMGWLGGALGAFPLKVG